VSTGGVVLQVAALGLAVAAIFAVPQPAGATVVKGAVTFRGSPFPGNISVADAVVIIHGPRAQTTNGRAVIDQRERRFIPRVLAVAPGTTVEFPNHDTVHHNARSRSGAQQFDLGLYAPGETRSAVFEAAGIVEIRCSAHPEMEAWVVVSDSSHFAQVTAGGFYQIRDVPPGGYEVEVWHPDVAAVRRSLTVPPDVPVLTVDLDLRERRGP
jgi:plastocyanin